MVILPLSTETGKTKKKRAAPQTSLYTKVKSECIRSVCTSVSGCTLECTSVSGCTPVCICVSGCTPVCFGMCKLHMHYCLHHFVPMFPSYITTFRSVSFCMLNGYITIVNRDWQNQEKKSSSTDQSVY